MVSELWHMDEFNWSKHWIYDWLSFMPAVLKLPSIVFKMILILDKDSKFGNFE
jgi:hypothetical protein